jgi:hypothetical protein
MGSDLSICECVATDDVDEGNSTSYGLWDLNTGDLKDIQNHISTQTSTVDTSASSPCPSPSHIWKLRKQIFDYVSSGNIDGLNQIIDDPTVNISTFVWKVTLHILLCQTY